MKYVAALLTLTLSACGLLQPTDGCEPSPSEKSAWDAARWSNTANAYKSYLSEYPNGCYAPAANFMLRRPVEPVALQRVVSERSNIDRLARAY
ncbi:hypothetical protein [Yoonia sediminilitoris]|uniref:Uncharacterized protein n=1 Tax=Yoonia sediminilitoris TaxID=1286148 RepID=A0A2T6KMX8_9RHOB|nr:hypothetical protein [Yoonia sediminilitoris]PUB17573.1 hypothetical protein C8N45_102585 [Yoonia sediminilitoris]RCW97868.1 hypothetical protein DFP92_102585 [Yoonia sediminilitoris]